MLRRLSYSNFQNNLILKGGLFLYSITNFEGRPTRDIDFLMKDYPNENKKLEEKKIIQLHKRYKKQQIKSRNKFKYILAIL